MSITFKFMSEFFRSVYVSQCKATAPLPYSYLSVLGGIGDKVEVRFTESKVQSNDI